MPKVEKWPWSFFSKKLESLLSEAIALKITIAEKNREINWIQKTNLTQIFTEIISTSVKIIQQFQIMALQHNPPHQLVVQKKRILHRGEKKPNLNN